MDKRHINRNRRLATAAALAIAGVAGLNRSASADLTLQLTTSTGNATLGNSNVTIAPGDTTPITLDIWAKVVGGAGNANPELFQSADFSLFGPSGQGQGTIVGSYSAPTLITQFKANGAQDSTTTPAAFVGPVDGDAGNDVGSTNTADAANWMIARSSQPIKASTGTFAFGITDGFEVKLGTVTFTPSTGITAGTSNLSIKGRNTTNGALWFEDSTSAAGTGGGTPPPVWYNDKNPTTGALVNGLFAINVVAAGAVTAEWTQSAGGAWNTASPGNWTPATVPGQTVPGAAGGDIAQFKATGNTAGTTAVSLTQNQTLGGIVFGPVGGAGYSITGANTITMNNGTPANPTITNSAGNNTIGAAVTLA